MNMVIKAHDVFVEHQGRTILDIKNLEVYEFDRIGLIGVNGAGKTTLLKILSGEVQPEEGVVTRYARISQITQLDELDLTTETDPAESSRLGIGRTAQETASGGELTRMKIAQAFTLQAGVLLADEPTCHLDHQGIDLLIERLNSFYGAIITVSHDRAFLDAVVNTIWELNDGTITAYPGNYSDYREQKEAEEALHAKNRHAYLEEKTRLQAIIQEKKKEAARVANKSKAKKNNDKSGGRLSHQKSQGSKEKKLQMAAKSFEKKLEALDEVSPLRSKPRVHFKQAQALELHNRFPIVGKDVNLKRGTRLLLQDAQFEIPLGAKVAIVGENGCGKTALLTAILHEEEGITQAPKAEIGYFSQLKKALHVPDTVLSYLQKESDYTVTEIRSALAAVGITEHDINKPVEVLSGGQIIKLTLIKVLLGRHNILLLDEPDNYLDLSSIEALQQMIKDYRGTIVFVTHDRMLVEQAADLVYRFEGRKLVT